MTSQSTSARSSASTNTIPTATPKISPPPGAVSVRFSQPPSANVLPFLRPTHLHLVDDNGQSLHWNGRQQRKRRYAPRRFHVIGDDGTAHTALLRVRDDHMLAKLNVIFDATWAEAVAFWFGSVVWVINGFLVWMPYLHPNVESDAVSKAAAGLAFLGGTVFEIGSYFMVVEAVNRVHETTFHAGIGRLLDKEERENTCLEKECESAWRYFCLWIRPVWNDAGYCAAVCQMFAATIFWVSTITGLPNVIPGMADGKQVAVTDVFFWTPQVIGGTFFVIASLILVLEAQTRWWRPNPFDLGWNVGFWNLIGSAGFLLCGAFGYSPNHGMQYQSGLATFWGSWAFLISSGFQLIEASFRDPPHHESLDEKEEPHGQV